MLSVKKLFNPSNQTAAFTGGISRFALACGAGLVIVLAGCRGEVETETERERYGETERERYGGSPPENEITLQAPPPAETTPPPTSFPAAPAEPFGAGAMEEFQQTQLRLQEVNTRLALIEQAVTEREDVKQARQELEDAAMKKIEEIDPGFQEDIAELNALGERIQQSGELDEGPGDVSESVQKDIEAFYEKREKLAGLEQQALQDPELQALQAGFQETVTAALKEVDPEAEGLIEERQKLMAKLQSLQEEVMRRHQLQQPGPPRFPQP